MKPPRKWESLGEIGARQRNSVWPDTLRNSALVDAFVWRGSPNPTYVQRIGTALFGLLFMCPAVLLVRLGFFEPGPALVRVFMFLLALPWALIGFRLLRNAVRYWTRRVPLSPRSLR